MRYNRTVIGYHGCHESTAAALLTGAAALQKSVNDYDWLGPGVYFWEYGEDRARRWAEDKHGAEGAVVGAVIHLGECFDLLDTRFTRDLGEAFAVFAAKMREDGRDIPENRGRPPELKARFRDCAVLKWYLEMLEERQRKSYDTVRGGFAEGAPAFEGSGIQAETHIQLAVRNERAIVGVFRPLVV